MKNLMPLAALGLLSSLGFSQTLDVVQLPGGEQRLTVETSGGQEVLRTSPGAIFQVRSVGAADQAAQFLRWREVAADGSTVGAGGATGAAGSAAGSAGYGADAS